MLIIHAGLLAWSAYHHSPVFTEVGHLPAGISHWTFGRFDLYRVNPPLVRMVAALPVMAANPKVDWSHLSSDPLAREERRVGIDFVNANGARSFWLYTIGRWACIPFSLLGAWICYCWARELYGVPSGLTAMALWCFCPNILGNGALIMPDVPAAALGAAATYTFWRWLKQPNWLDMTIVGIVLGLAELTKTTLLILYPLFLVLWIVYRWRSSVGSWVRELGGLTASFLISIYVINTGYFFEGSLKRLGDYQFESGALTGQSSKKGLLPGNRFADSARSVDSYSASNELCAGNRCAKTRF